MASSGGAAWGLLLFTAGVVVISGWSAAFCLRFLRSAAGARYA